MANFPSDKSKLSDLFRCYFFDDSIDLVYSFVHIRIKIHSFCCVFDRHVCATLFSFNFSKSNFLVLFWRTLSFFSRSLKLQLTKLWSDDVSAPGKLLQLFTELIHLLLTSIISIMFLSFPFGDSHVLFLLGLCLNLVLVTCRSFSLTNCSKQSPLSLLDPKPNLPITSSQPFLFEPILAFQLHQHFYIYSYIYIFTFTFIVLHLQYYIHASSTDFAYIQGS